MTMIKVFDVHKNVQHLLEIKEYKTIVDLVDMYSDKGHIDELVSIFEALTVAVKDMEYKSEAESLYDDLMFPSINKLMDRNMKEFASHFFEQGEGVIAKEIELKPVC